MHEVRGVGKNMQDHDVACVSYPVVGAQTANERSRGLPAAGEVMRWLFTGKGILTYNPSIVAASVKVLEELVMPMCKSPSPPAASREARSANSRRRRASAPARGHAAVVARLCRGQIEPPRATR